MSVLLTILALSLLVFLWSRRRIYKLSWQLKGPLGLPLIGNVELLNPKNVLRYFTYLTKTYKTPTTVWIGPICFLYVNDPENMQRVLKAPEFLNKSMLYKAITRLIGDGLLSNNNPKWIVHRKLINPVFNHKTLLSFFPVFNSETDILCMKFKRHADTNESINIKDFMERFTLSNACQTTMGTRLNLQLDENNQILKASNSLIASTSKEFFNLLYRLEWFTKVFDFKFYETRKKALEDITHFVNLFIFGKLYQKDFLTNSVKAEEANNSFIKSENIFIDHVTNLFQNKSFSMEDVMSESFHIIVAAYETTSKALFNIMTLLAIHPEWQDKLYEEIKQAFPDKNFDVLLENLQDVPLAEMIINETLRLLPVVPLIARQTDVDIQLNNDIFVPKGTNIGLDIYSMQRNPKYWGPNAHEFNPDHFLPDAIKSRHPYVFVPFSKGYRNCIGWRYAYFVLKIFLIKIFRNYRFTTTTKMEEIELYFNIVARLKVEPVFEIYTRED